MSYRLIQGDCLEVLPTLQTSSIDAVITDPPYPCIKRSYGTWTEAEWWKMMRALIPEVRRVLKPTGSAVFVLQPNSRKVGSMRPWLWDFMAWVCREWNMVQDVWWWNCSALTEGHSIQGRLLRPSIKGCVWCGPPDCYRNQKAVLWDVAQATYQRAAVSRCGREREIRPSGHSMDSHRATIGCIERGGSLPFNVLPFGGGKAAGVLGHSAGTPLKLCHWWTRYICSPGGTVLDPFSGSGTAGVAALKEGRSYVGVERLPEYHAIAQKRLAETALPLTAEAA